MDNQEKEIMFISDESDHLCSFCKTNLCNIHENGEHYCQNCFYKAKKTAINDYLDRAAAIKQIKKDLEPDYNEITPKIIIGNQDCGYSKQFLEENNISHILVCGENYPKMFESQYKYETLSIDDSPDANLLPLLYNAICFIESSSNKVLVHCAMGMSRSPSIVIGYLMYSNKESFENAFEKVISKREIIDPNPGFIKQLKYFEEVLKGINYDLSKLKDFEFKNEKWKN